MRASEDGSLHELLPADASFPCDKAAVLGDKIEGTL
jgi:hypothetical protein